MWIAVADRLPESGKSRLVYYTVDNPVVLTNGENDFAFDRGYDISGYRKNTKQWTIERNDSSKHVTHWMELPDTPTTGEQP